MKNKKIKKFPGTSSIKVLVLMVTYILLPPPQ